MGIDLDPQKLRQQQSTFIAAARLMRNGKSDLTKQNQNLPTQQADEVWPKTLLLLLPHLLMLFNEGVSFARAHLDDLTDV